jgi:hypothetical protein
MSGYDIAFALHIAKCWRAGKMIGGDEDEVRDALLKAFEDLHSRLENVVKLCLAIRAEYDSPHEGTDYTHGIDAGRKELADEVIRLAHSADTKHD